jgi:hypothetical protein
VQKMWIKLLKPSTSNSFPGIVTLPNEDREEPAAAIVSGRCSRGPPRVHRRGTKTSVRLSGCYMALDVERVVDGGGG